MQTYCEEEKNYGTLPLKSVYGFQRNFKILKAYKIPRFIDCLMQMKEKFKLSYTQKQTCSDTLLCHQSVIRA